MTPPQNNCLPQSPAAGHGTDLVTDRCPRAVPHARAHLRAVMRPWHIPRPLADDAALLVTELATNAVHHGTGPVLRVHTRCHRHVLHCQIHDDGPAVALTPTSRGSLAENGRGLALVDALATRWGAYTDPTLAVGQHVVWFQLTWPETDPDILRRVLAGLRGSPEIRRSAVPLGPSVPRGS